MTKMTDLNALDGDSMLQEVMKERVAKDRVAYKKAINNAVIRLKNAEKAATKAVDRVEHNQEKLDKLVDGGIEGFLIKKDDEELKKPNMFSMRS